MHDFSTPTQDSPGYNIPKSSNTTLPFKTHQKSNTSIQSLKFSDRLSILSTHTESLRLHFQLDQLKNENKHLKSALQEKTEFFQQEIKKREDIIFSMSSMVRDRENQFMQLLQSQEKEKNLIIGGKEAEIDRCKKLIEDLRQSSSSFDSFDLLKTQEKEIENLRKVLKMTEKENKHLLKRVKDSDPLVFKEKWKENDNYMKDVCFEIGILVDSISRFRNIISKVLKEESSVDQVLKTSASDRDDIGKTNVIPIVKENAGIIKGLQDLLLDLYAGKFVNVCSLQ